MILCDNCGETSGYIMKDRGTIFCLNCLHFIQTKPSCKGECNIRCIKCSKTQDELREIENLLKQYK